MTDRVRLGQLQEFFPGQRMSTYLLVLPEHDVVYVKNPKAACSTLTQWLDRIHTGELDHEFGNIHKEHRVPRIRKRNRRLFLDILSGQHGYRFTFVRHPARRLESAYWNKIVHTPKWRAKIPAQLGIEVDPDDTLSFEGFLDAVEQQDPVAGMNPHWRPQHINLMHPVVSYDRVGRIEDFDADLRRVVEEAGLPEVPYSVRNSARHQHDSVYDGRPDLLRRVEELYATDMELYGY